MYILLCGSPPFFGINEEEIYRKILTCNFTFRHKIWNEISQEAKDLINRLLELDPKKE
jgi:calcium-dependent protein kinase